MELLRESLVNISNLPDINLDVAFTTLFFLTAKDLMLMHSRSLKSMTISVLLGSTQSEMFLSTFLDFLFFLRFYFFSKDSTALNSFFIFIS